MFSDYHVFESFLGVPGTLPCQLVRISFIDGHRDFEITESSPNFLKLAKISAEDGYVSGSTVWSLFEEIEDQFLNHINLV